MLKVVTARQMREVDRRTIEDVGLPGVVLMENAGGAVVSAIKEKFENLERLKVSVFAGKGNNGGDGFVIARRLLNLGADPTVYLSARRDEPTGDAKTNMEVFIAMGGRVKEISDSRHLKNFKLKFMHSAVVVDALLGTGIKSAPRDLYAQIIGVMNSLRGYKVAVDVPSGMDSDSGVVPGDCFKADVTVTFGLPKVGLLTSPARNYAGDITVADIGIPDIVIKDSACRALLIEQADIPKILPSRAWDAHKGRFGHLVIAGGSSGMGGAVALAGGGALRMGTGLVTAVVPSGISGSFETGFAEMMTLPLDQTGEGAIAETATDKFMEFAEGKTAALIGPGLSTRPGAVAFARKVISSLKLPLVIDADGLNCIGEDVALLKGRAAPTIITPHPGEMGRLTGISAREVQADRIKTASDYALASGATVVLKGAGTVIATPDGKVFLNHTGNNGLATGGSGDVLAGMIAGLLAQGAHMEDAATAGVYIHGLCADVYAEKQAVASLLPSDLISLIPVILKKISG